ncbi:MAG: outer rane immunogenic protein [Hyphomicrobiales bacterium]|jgi:opacity protein-like surface antigen|nr:outer rane immunogenic protein [Hyphomicrobiales bacterium]
MRRWLLCGIAIVGTALEAQAADLGDSFLRGSNTVIAAPGGPRWDGFYIGGHVGMSAPGIDFTNNTSYLAAVLDGTPVTSRTATPLGSVDSTSKHFGGFVGYQQQWDGAVIGVEGTYNWMDKALSATNGISGSFAPAINVLTYTAAGTETARIIDYGTLRVRGGWAAGMFMPYATFGIAVGRLDLNRNVVVTPSATAASPAGAFVPPPFTVSQSFTNQFGYGYAAGLGVDFCLMANLFARAEYEYVQFPDFQGLNAHIHNVRVGAALKF